MCAGWSRVCFQPHSKATLALVLFSLACVQTAQNKKVSGKTRWPRGKESPPRPERVFIVLSLLIQSSFVTRTECTARSRSPAAAAVRAREALRRDAGVWNLGRCFSDFLGLSLFSLTTPGSWCRVFVGAGRVGRTLLCLCSGTNGLMDEMFASQGFEPVHL